MREYAPDDTPGASSQCAAALLPKHLAPQSGAAQFDSLFRDHPELLFGLVQGPPESVRTKLFAPLGLPTPGVWDAFRLTVDLDVEDFSLWMDRFRGYVERYVEDNGGTLRPAWTAAKSLRRSLRDLFEAAESGEIDQLPYVYSALCFGYFRGEKDIRRLFVQAAPRLRRLILDTQGCIEVPLLPLPPEREGEERSPSKSSASERIAELEAELQSAARRSAEMEASLREESERRVQAETQMQEMREELERLEWELWNRIPGQEKEEASEELPDTQALREKLEMQRKTISQMEAEMEEMRSIFRQLFQDEASEPQPHPQPGERLCLAGRRVLVVGGLPKTEAEVRATIESLGGVMVHDAGAHPAQAASKVRKGDLVVFATRHMTHSLYDRVKATARTRGAEILHWNARSSDTLRRLFVQEVSPEAAA